MTSNFEDLSAGKDTMDKESIPSTTVPYNPPTQNVDNPQVITPTVPPPSGLQIRYPDFSILQTTLLIGSLFLCIFCFAVDQSIIATAIPKITADFNSLKQVSWIVNGYFVTLLGFSMVYGQFLGVFMSRDVMLAAMFLFEVGSIICAVSPSIGVLIFGRVFSGIGAAGIFSCATQILAETINMGSRAKYLGGIGAVFAVSGILGPVLGGIFTDSSRLTWRWCFWLNLPLGFTAMLALLYIVPARPPLGREVEYQGYGWHMFRQFLRCDWVGVALLNGWAALFTLVFEWAGVTKKWSDPGVITILVLIPFLTAALVGWELFIGAEKGMIPIPVVKRRNIAAGMLSSCFGFGNTLLLIYYLSIHWQSAYGKSAISAGVHILTLVACQITALIVSSKFIETTGIYMPILTVGPLLCLLGTALAYTINSTTSEAHLMGYQAIIGTGSGLFLQNSILLAQYALAEEPALIAQGVSLIIFAGFIGRIVGVSGAGSIFGNQLPKQVLKYAPGISKVALGAITSSAKAVYETEIIPLTERPLVIQGYVKTLGYVYLLGMGLSALAFFSAFVYDGKRLKKKQFEVKSDKDVEEQVEA